MHNVSPPGDKAEDLWFAASHLPIPKWWGLSTPPVFLKGHLPQVCRNCVYTQQLAVVCAYVGVCFPFIFWQERKLLLCLFPI